MYGCVSIGIPHVFSVILFSIKCSKVPSSESSESSESSTLPFGQVRGVKGEPDGNGPAESRKPPTPPAVPNASDREHTVLPERTRSKRSRSRRGKGSRSRGREGERHHKRRHRKRERSPTDKRSSRPPTLRRLDNLRLRSRSPPGDEGISEEGLVCPICEKVMRTQSEFSLSQHIWSCHPNSKEGQIRSQEYMAATKAQQERIKRGRSVVFCPELQRARHRSAVRQSPRPQSWHPGQSRNVGDDRPPLRRNVSSEPTHVEPSSRGPCRDDTTTDLEEVQNKTQDAVPVQLRSSSDSMMSEFFRTTQMFLQRKHDT